MGAAVPETVAKTNLACCPQADTGGVTGGMLPCSMQLTLLEHERWALELIARDAPVQEVLTQLCLAVEKALSHVQCAVLLVNTQGTHLTSHVAPSLPHAYVERMRTIPIGPDVGSCGTAAYSKAPVIACDLATDPRWRKHAALALEVGLRACWSWPFFCDQGEVAGTLAIYSGTPRTPTEQELQLVQSTTRLAEVAVRQERTRRALNAVEAERSVLFHTIGAGILTFDADGALASANTAACQALGMTEPQVKGQHLAEVFGAAVAEQGNVLDWGGMLVDPAALGKDLLFAIRTPAQEQRWLRATLSTLPGESGALLPRSLVCSFIDVTQMKQAQEELAARATFDELTGLLNRSALMREAATMVQAAAQGGRGMAMLVVDLDGFKYVNDTLGHAAGDVLLREVATRLSGVVRAPSVLARRTGDEFVILVAGDEDSAAKVAAQVLDALGQPFLLAQQEILVSASIGAALCPQHASTDAELLRHADAAMYQAKRSGRNRFVVHQRLAQPGCPDRLLLESQLRYAIVRQELALHYQPRVSAVNGQICGVEALVRWNHPELGLVPPGEFIPLAEQTGLVVPIGEWVLHEACMQAARWHAAGHGGLRVSVNVAAQQLNHAFLANTVPRILEKSGIDPGTLELEVTETSMMASMDQDTHAAMQALRLRGVRFLLDDFGTGYSSLSYLHRFPLDGLKVDRSFVLRLLDAPDARAITRAVIGMAKALKLHITAEGVECSSQGDWLASHGCDELQGFLYARPMPAQGLEHWLHPLQVQPVAVDAGFATAPLPPDEPQRLEAIARSGVRLNRHNATLDAIVHAVANLLDVHMAAVCIVEADHQWFAASVGIDVEGTPRDVSFGAHVLLGDGVMVVEDARGDPRFAGNPFVTGSLGMRFFAGVPLKARDAHGRLRNIGSLSAIDREPRVLDAIQRRLLTKLATVASRTIDEVLPRLARMSTGSDDAAESSRPAESGAT